MEERQNIRAWKDARFGMFIHWGLYALMGRGEWVMYNEALDKDEYHELMHQFTAEKFDARAWAKTAKEAGMKYMVLTTRHHDGFSLWDSHASYENFTAMESAAHKDFVREYVDACREEGLLVGFYYSPLDWRFPGFFFPRMYRQSAEALREQTFGQIRELLTDYGRIDILWFDGGEDGWLCHGRNLHINEPQTEPQCPGFWHTDEMNEMIHTLQPDIVVNNRYGDASFGDFTTPEQKIGEFNTQKNWESCMTLCDGAWGWVPERNPKSLRTSLTLLLQAVTGDGNFLYNVGPRADGTIEPADVRRLKEMGEWLSLYGESVYGTRGGPVPNTASYGMTHKGITLYLHVWNWDADQVTVPVDHVMKWECLTTDDYQCTYHDGHLTFSVAQGERDMIDSILKITVERPVD